MGTLTLDLDSDVIDVLNGLDQSAEQSAVELIAFELFRRGLISGGKAAALLGMTRLGFIRYADRLGIPYFNLTPEEWEAERDFIDVQ
jgi:hypothetical protein